MKFLKVFEGWTGNFEIPTYGELNQMIIDGQVDTASGNHNKPDLHLKGHSDRKICEPSEIKDLGHEYHDYSWVLHPYRLNDKKIKQPIIYFTLFEDGKVVGNYVMMSRYYLFGDILILYSGDMSIFINLMTNKAEDKFNDDLTHEPLTFEGGDYEFRCEERFDRFEGTFDYLLICTRKSEGKVVEFDLSIRGPMWDRPAEPHKTYTIQSDELNESLSDGVSLPTEKEIMDGIESGSIKSYNGYGGKPDLRSKKSDRWSEVQDLGHDYHDYKWATFKDDTTWCGRIDFFGLFEDGELVSAFPIDLRREFSRSKTKQRGFFRIDDILIFFSGEDPGIHFILNLNNNQPEFVGHSHSFTSEGGEYQFEYLKWKGVLICKKMSERQEYHYMVPIPRHEPKQGFVNEGLGRLIKVVDF